MAQAKKKPGTDLVPSKPDANLPAFLAGYKGPMGTENIDQGDVAIPRVKIGQGLSTEVKDGIVNIGDLFLNIGGVVIAKKGEKVPFVIVAQAKEFILWRPREDNGGGILARARPVDGKDGKRYVWDKPDQKFDVKVGGKVKATWKTGKDVESDGLGDWGSEIPGDKDSGIAATAHHNYVVVFPTKGNLIAALSLSRSQTKRAKDLNYMLKMGNAPLFARLFNMETTDESNEKGDFANIKFTGNGFVTEEQFPFMKSLFEGFVGRTINVDRSDGDDEATDDRA